LIKIGLRQKKSIKPISVLAQATVRKRKRKVPKNTSFAQTLINLPVGKAYLAIFNKIPERN
jgi:hypothetical protein